MNIAVKFFAVSRDISGHSELMLELPKGTTVAGLVDCLVRSYPSLAPWRSHLRIAVNYEYSNDARVLTEGDEIGVIPPVSGG